MTSLDKAPASVQAWFAAEKSPEPAAALRALLAPDVVFDFGAHKIHGLTDVLGAVGLMMPPGWLGDVVWSLLPTEPDGSVTVRGVGRDGVMLKSPGGPIDVIDYTFTLAADGLIAKIHPKPSHPEAPGVARPLQPGEAAPDFVLPDVQGAQVRLHEGGAKATVVAFTCNHCPWAMGWHDRLQRVAKDYAARGVRFLQINPNVPSLNPDDKRDSVETSRKRVAEGHFAGPYLIDENQLTARRWGARHTPDLFVLDAKGHVAYHGAPDGDVEDESLNAGWLRRALDQVLAGTAASPAQTQPVGCSIKWTPQ